MSLDQLPFNVFDIVLIAVLVMGLVRGRRHGMSEELIYLLQWLCVLTACTFLYEPLGQFLAQVSPISLLSCYVIVYVAIALIIIGLFALVKHQMGNKLLGSDVFGQSEFYLGMASGLVRFACILLTGLALLNARYFSSAEVQAYAKFQNDVYGSEFFPGLSAAQATVFQTSLTGPWIRENLSVFLIKPTAPEDKRLRQKEFAFPN